MTCKGATRRLLFRSLLVIGAGQTHLADAGQSESCEFLAGCVESETRHLSADDPNLETPFGARTKFEYAGATFEMWASSVNVKAYESEEYSEMLFVGEDSDKSKRYFFVQARSRDTGRYTYVTFRTRGVEDGVAYLGVSEFDYGKSNDSLKPALKARHPDRYRVLIDTENDGEWRDGVIDAVCGRADPDADFDRSCIPLLIRAKKAPSDFLAKYWDLTDERQSRNEADTRDGRRAETRENLVRSGLKELLLPELGRQCGFVADVSRGFLREMVRANVVDFGQARGKACEIGAFTGWKIWFWFDNFESDGCVRGSCVVRFEESCVYAGASGEEVCDKLNPEGTPFKAIFSFEDGLPVSLDGFAED